MAKSFLRGHPIEYNGRKWVYSDNKAPIDSEVRVCVRCGQQRTPEGYDACLGYLPGVTAACCGHGVEEPYNIKGESV